MVLTVAASVLARLAAEAVAAAPEECCGVLLGRPSGRDITISGLLPARNVAVDRRRRFEIDPLVLLAAHKAARAGGPAIAGWYHSHPSGTAEPSPTDRARGLGDGKVWAIIADHRIGFWRDTTNGFQALSHRVAVD